MLTPDQIVKLIADGVRAVLVEKQSKGKLVIPSGSMDALVREMANNVAAPIVLELGEHMDAAHLQQLEQESLFTKLHNAGGRGATLDIMLTSVLEDAKLSHAARDASRKLVAAADAVVEAFDEGDIELFHPDTDDGPGRTIACPEDDTCECKGPAAFNELARTRDIARRELGS